MHDENPLQEEEEANCMTMMIISVWLYRARYKTSSCSSSSSSRSSVSLSLSLSTCLRTHKTGGKVVSPLRQHNRWSGITKSEFHRSRLYLLLEGSFPPHPHPSWVEKKTISPQDGREEKLGGMLSEVASEDIPPPFLPSSSSMPTMDHLITRLSLSLSFSSSPAAVSPSLFFFI